MKKLLLVVLAMSLVFTLVACGENNEKNNAEVQVVMDDLEKVYQEIYSFYEDNGFIEAGVTDGLNSVTEAHNETKATHETYLADGGYSKDLAELMIEALDGEIIMYNEMLTGMQEMMAE